MSRLLSVSVAESDWLLLLLSALGGSTVGEIRGGGLWTHLACKKPFKRGTMQKHYMQPYFLYFKRLNLIKIKAYGKWFITHHKVAVNR